MKAMIQITIVLLSLSCAAARAEGEMSCALGHDQLIYREMFRRVGALAERTKKKSGIDYSLPVIAENSRFRALFSELSTALMGDIYLEMESGYTTAKGTKLVFAFTDDGNPKQKLSGTRSTFNFKSFLTGQKHDREGNITELGHCELRAHRLFGNPHSAYLSLFNAETGIWLNGLDLSSETFKIY